MSMSKKAAFADAMKQGFQRMQNAFSKPNRQKFWHEFKGGDVRNLDKQIKDLNSWANTNGHKTYIDASKRFRGWGIIPGHENYRNQSVQNNPKQQRLYKTMATKQEARKAASKLTNRARLKVGGVALAGAGLVAGGIALKKAHDKKKAENEYNEGFSNGYSNGYDNGYTKTAAAKSSLFEKTRALSSQAKKGVVDTGKQIKKNFEHAPELDYMYSGSKRKALKDVVTLKRVREANKVLKQSGKYFNYVDRPSFSEYNRKAFSLYNANAENSRLEKVLKAEKSKIDRASDLSDIVEKSKKSFGKDKKGGFVNYSDERRALNKKIKSMVDTQNKLKSDASEVVTDLAKTISNVKKTRNNEIAKAVGIYSIPIAATAGGVYLYRKHKKKKSEEKSDNS